MVLGGTPCTFRVPSPAQQRGMRPRRHPTLSPPPQTTNVTITVTAQRCIEKGLLVEMVTVVIKLFRLNQYNTVRGQDHKLDSN